MRGPSSAHKGVERASGPKATCEIMNDATLEISKLILLTIWTQICSVPEMRALGALIKRLIIVLTRIRNYHTLLTWELYLWLPVG